MLHCPKRWIATVALLLCSCSEPINLELAIQPAQGLSLSGTTLKWFLFADPLKGGEVANGELQLSSAGKQLMMEGLSLREGESYRLFTFGAHQSCTNGGVSGLSPWFRHRASGQSVSVYIGCIGASRAIEAPATKRSLHSATLVQRDGSADVFFVGGAELVSVADLLTPADGNFHTTIERYDLASGRFSTLPQQLSRGRLWHQTTHDGDDGLLVMGGVTPVEVAEKKRLAALGAVDRIAANSVTSLQGLMRPRWGHVVLGADGILLVAGGSVTQGSFEVGTLKTEIYFGKEGVSGGEYLPMRQPHILPMAAYAGASGVLIAGGYATPTTPNPGIEFFCSKAEDCGCSDDTGCFLPIAGWGKSRVHGAAVSVDCGAQTVVYLIGGQASSATDAEMAADIYCFDGRPTSRVRKVGNLQQARQLHTATAVAVANTPWVFIAGGLGKTAAALPTAELFEASCSCDVINSPVLLDLENPRAGHSATLLPDNTVLLVGGLGGATAERFVPPLERPGQ